MKTLSDYQVELEHTVATVTLLGQLPYDEKDLEALRGLFADRCQVDGPAWKRSFRGYGLALALYLVLEGVYSYKRGDYWTRPSEVLGLTTPVRRSHIGDLFHETLEQAGLPTFGQLGGHIYVAPILAHGGIPNYCLDDFFSLLDNAERRKAMVDTSTLLDEWQDRFPAAIDVPIQRFLLNGRSIAEDFVERCRELWHPDIPDLKTLDLPPRVLEAFERWQIDQPARAQSRQTRLPRPRLIIDPFDEGLAIALPSVLFPEQQAPRQLHWRLSANDRTRTERAYRRLLGDEVEFTTDSGTVMLATVAEAYSVELLADDGVLRSWVLPGPAHPPLLAFDTAGELLLDRRRDQTTEYWIPPGEYILLFPQGRPIEAINARAVGELPPLGGDWAAFTAERWELEPDAWVEVAAADGSETVSFHAYRDRGPQRPVLAQPPLWPPDHRTPYALYSGRPPDVLIPHNRDGQLGRWRVTITPRGTADPIAQRAFPIAELAHRLRTQPDGACLPLSAPELLGDSPVGEFHVRLRGPYGGTADFQLRLTPHLQLRDQPRLYRRDSDGPTRVTVAIAKGHTLQLRDPSIPGIQLAPGPTLPTRVQEWRIAADPAVASLPLRIQRADGAGIDLDIPVYRVRWTLYDPAQPDALVWTTQPLRKFPQALENRHALEVRAQIPRWAGAPEIIAGWRLIDADGRVLSEQPPAPHRQKARYSQTRLAAWLDTYYAAGSVAALELALAVAGEPTPDYIPVLHLLPALTADEVEFSWVAATDCHTLTLLFSGLPAVRRRALRLWAQDRPDLTPLTLPIPDAATEFAEWTLPSERLPVGEYLGQLVIDDPWQTVPTRPEPDADGILFLSPDHWVDVLVQQIEAARNGELDAAAALALLRWTVRNWEVEHVEDISHGIWRHHRELTVDQLLWWADAISLFERPTATSQMRKALFSPARLAEMANGSWTGDQLARCCRHLVHGLELEAYRTLLPYAAGEPRELCLWSLCAAGDTAAYAQVLGLRAADEIDEETAVSLLQDNPERAANWLFARDDPAAEALLHALLQRYNVMSFIYEQGEILVEGLTVRITGIADVETGKRMKQCPKGRKAITLDGLAAPYGAKVPVRLDMAASQIMSIGGPLYQCYLCHRLSVDADKLGRHYLSEHRISESPRPATKEWLAFKRLMVIAKERIGL